MPQRTNEFQRLVYLVRTHLDPSAKVTESAMLTNRFTGQQSEVDVFVEGKLAQHPVTVSIECLAKSRPADVGWVNQMKGKHEGLPTNALILASQSGFTKGARLAANAAGITLISLQALDEINFESLLGSKSTLWMKTVTFRPTSVTVQVVAKGEMPAETVLMTPDNVLYDADGKEIGWARSYVGWLLRQPKFSEMLRTPAAETHKWFTAETENVLDIQKRRLCLKKVAPETLREIERIKIIGTLAYSICEFVVNRGNLDGVLVEWGQTEIDNKPAMLVASTDRTGTPTVSLTLNEDSGSTQYLIPSDRRSH